MNVELSSFRKTDHFSRMLQCAPPLARITHVNKSALQVACIATTLQYARPFTRAPLLQLVTATFATVLCCLPKEKQRHLSSFWTFCVEEASPHLFAALSIGDGVSAQVDV